MKSILIVFFVLMFFVLVLIIPFKSRMMSHFNFLEMKGFYSIKIWRIRILCGKIYINQNGEIEADNLTNLMSSNYNKSFVKGLSKELISKLDVKKIEMYFTGGFVNNSFSSAMVCGSVSSIVQTMFSVLSQKYKNVKLFEDIIPTFNEDNFEITFDVVLSISIFQIILSILKANKFKENKNER